MDKTKTVELTPWERNTLLAGLGFVRSALLEDEMVSHDTMINKINTLAGKLSSIPPNYSNKVVNHEYSDFGQSDEKH